MPASPPVRTAPARVHVAHPRTERGTRTPRPPRRPRPAWRERLVEVERGFVFGLRRDSVLFGHLFVWCLCVAAAFTFELSAVRWAVLLVALSGALAAELFHQVLRAVLAELGPASAEALRPALRMATAAVAVAAFGATLAVGLVFAETVREALGP